MKKEVLKWKCKYCGSLSLFPNMDGSVCKECHRKRLY